MLCWCRIYTPFNEQDADNGGFILLFALGNVAIILVLVVVMTFCLVLLFKYKCYLVSCDTHIVQYQCDCLYTADHSYLVNGCLRYAAVLLLLLPASVSLNFKTPILVVYLSV